MQHLKLIKDVWYQGEKEALEDQATQAQIIYNQFKIENSELIDCNIILPEGYGIINCRVNGTHKQIRF